MKARKFIHLHGATAIVLTLMCVIMAPGMAQNESGVRQISKEGFRKQGIWYEDSNVMYQVRYPILRSLPPINTGMSLDVLRSYLYVDSLMRFDQSGAMLQSVQTWRAANDTLKHLVANFYRIVDYNPMIFAQYMTEVNFKYKVRYWPSLKSLYQATLESIKKVIPSNQDRNALYSVLYADYILRIRVIGIDSMLGRPVPSRLDPYRYQVTAEVLDVLKGQEFLPCGIASKSLSTDGRTMLGANSASCIQFQYVQGNYFEDGLISSSGKWIYPKKDPEFMAYNGYFKMKPGQEAIIFLKHHASLYDSSADYFDIILEPQASYNALPIINGQVRDVNHVWSGDSLTSYPNWKQRFYALRERIHTGSY